MLDVCVLGAIAARVDGEMTTIASRAQRAVLAAVARDVGRVVPAERLVGLVWGDDPPMQPVTSLRSHVSRLRATLQADVVAADHGGYVLTVDRAHVDACRFERQVARSESLALLDDALGLWRGEPFGEFGDLPFFAPERARLRELHLQARERRCAMLIDASRPEDAVADLQALVAAHSLREPPAVLLVRALHAAGRQAEAVAAAGRYRQHMVAEGLEPSVAFRAVEDEVFRTRRLPPVQPAPAGLATVIGRERETADLVDLLGQRRLVTLVGPGGVGKTTLAQEVARRVRVDDVWIVDLTAVDVDGSVIAAVARATGAALTEPLERAVQAHLSGRCGLVVLDNAEHVVPGVADAARVITGAGAELRVLVTSRQPLGVGGERLVDVEPLERQHAIALFSARAADQGRPVADSDHALVGEICDRLDRLPLAIEMAAARLRGLSLAALGSRLDEHLQLLRGGGGDTDPRHGTLAQVVDWSYGLLGEDQRALFEQLSVFTGTFTVDDAEQVCAIAGHIDATLGELVDRSLVRHDPATGRYTLLETIRRFAADRRGPSHPVRRRHMAHHVVLAERIGQGLRSPEDTAWAERFDQHASDIEAALRWAIARGDADAPARVMTALYVLVYHRLRIDVGAWAAAALDVVTRAGHPLGPAVRAVVGLTLISRGDTAAAAEVLTDLPDHPAARFGHEVLGDLCLYRGDLADARAHATRARALALDVGDHFIAVSALTTVALSSGYAGNRQQGLAIAADGAAAADPPLLRAWFTYVEAELRADTEPAEALALLDQVTTEATARGWTFLLGVALVTAGSARARHSEPADALRAFARMIRHWRRADDATHQWTTMRNLVDLFVRIGAHEPAAQLLGAATRAPSRTYGGELQRLRDASDRLCASLGADRFRALHDRGSGLTRAEAETVALGAIEALC